MSALENAKTYTGKNLETIFFRPMLSGPSAIDLGVRVLYNMPVPTTVQMWEPKTDILQKFTAAGWSGGAGSKKLALGAYWGHGWRCSNNSKNNIQHTYTHLQQQE